MYLHRAELRFSDTDAMGHVNHARFATLFEDARIGMLRSFGGDDRPITHRGIILARLEIDYLRPLMLDDSPVSVHTTVARVGTSSFAIDYELVARDQLCARGHSVQVAYDYAAGRSRPLNDSERAQLEAARDGGGVTT